MRIMATSDLHGNLPEVPECDLLLIAGDVCPDFADFRSGNAFGLADNGVAQGGWLDHTFRDWLDDIPAKHVVAIAGNHDYVFQTDHAPNDLRWTYLEDSVAIVGDVAIYGNPWVPNLRAWAFCGGSNNRVDPTYYSKMPLECDILLMHGPPFMYADKLNGGGKWGNAEDMHVGDKTLAGRLAREENKAKVVVCGHIHEGYGHYNHPKVEHGIYNVAMVDEFYDPREPECIEIVI
jgi:Icc-related predicted phosphoesterase